MLKGVFFRMLSLYIRLAAVKAIGGLNLSRGGLGGIRPPLGTEKTGIILANIKTTAETQPFISKKKRFSSAVVSLTLNSSYKQFPTPFSPRNHRGSQFGPKRD